MDRAIAASASVGIDLGEMLQTLTRHLVPTLGDVAVVRLMSQDRRWLSTIAVSHLDQRTQNAMRLALWEPYPARDPEGLSGPGAASPEGASVLIPSSQNASRAYVPATAGFHPVAVVSIALKVEGRILGVLDIARGPASPPFGPVEERLLVDLAPQVAALAENARRYSAALEAVRVRDELLTSITHDLKAPLTVIDATAQLLEREVSEAERGAKLVRRILDASHRMARDIADLIDVAQVQMGQPLPLNLRTVDLTELVNNALADHRQAASSYEFILETRGPELTGTWDPVRLRRSVDNLISNAVKYSPRGSTVTVTVGRVEDAGQTWAEIAVTDQGRGIPAADLPHVFDRFHRAQNVHRVGGSGVGLSVVMSIIQQHGGHVTVTSNEGDGSTFTVRLPLTPAAVTGSRAIQSAA